MPELPEVETVRRGLEPEMVGRAITKVVVRRPDLRFRFPENFAQRITGHTVKAVSRRSKYIWIHLSSGETLIVHLGMSGQVNIDHDGTREIGKHNHVSFCLSNGSQIHYTDPRRFGLMDLTATPELSTHKLFVKLGPEPLGNAWSADHLYAAIKSRRSPLKAALLDQTVVCGLGNIYVCEALFNAKIHPRMPATEITRHQCTVLVTQIRSILQKAIESGGSTLRDYVRSDGGLGYFQHQFAVYGRVGQACVMPSCAGTVQRTVQSNRSTFFCPTCQIRDT